MKKILVILLAFFTYINCAHASTCVTESMLEEAYNLKLEYKYIKETNDYEVSLTGLTSGDIYVYNSDGGQYIFDYVNLKYDEELGEYVGLTTEEKKYKRIEGNTIIITGIPSNNYNFVIAASGKNGCYEDIKTIGIDLKDYNKYADDERCEDINYEEFRMCDPWYEGEISEENFAEKLEEYKNNKEGGNEIIDNNDYDGDKEKNNVFEWINNYYLYIIISFVVIAIIILIIIINKKKGELE